MAKPWMRWLLVLQCVLLVAMLAGMLANKLALLAFRPAFMTFVYAFQGLMLVTALVVLASAVIWWRKWQVQKPAAKTALWLGIVPIAAIFALIGPGLSVPQIHNITTDLAQPPVFNAAYGLRDDSHNSLDVPDASVRELQRAYYKDLKPLVLEASPEAVYQRALATVEALGWTLIAADPGALTIEAYEETTFFGFKDDVVIRVQPVAEGARVDLRSVSRVGRSDLGANAKRIQRFLAALQQG